MTDRELMQQALEALEFYHDQHGEESDARVIADLRDRLAQTEPGPVTHTLNCVCGAVWDIKNDKSEEMVHTPDTTPPQRQWVGLTDEEADELVRRFSRYELIRAISRTRD